MSIPTLEGMGNGIQPPGALRYKSHDDRENPGITASKPLRHDFADVDAVGHTSTESPSLPGSQAVLSYGSDVGGPAEEAALGRDAATCATTKTPTPTGLPSRSDREKKPPTDHGDTEDTGRCRPAGEFLRGQIFFFLPPPL